jgi:hypothetical protein
MAGTVDPNMCEGRCICKVSFTIIYEFGITIGVSDFEIGI